jgi:hypothetical protein
MAIPVLDIRTAASSAVSSTLNLLANDGFETDTSGWSVSAGIQGAATSITRTTGGSPYMGLAVGRLVTTSTNGSGVKFVLPGTFVSGFSYRFRVYLKSVSGATTCGIRIGSLGTPGDRAVNTFTVTGTWTAYQVDFTPSANRTDIQVNVYTNSAAAMTVDIDAAEVYPVAHDLTPYADFLSFEYGLNFEGGLSVGSCTVRLKNDDKRFNTPGESKIYNGQPIYVRATYGGASYGLFYGTIHRLPLDLDAKMLELVATDIVDSWGVAAEVNVAASTTRSIADFRGLILDAIGEPAARRDLSTGEHEADTPVTGADGANALALIASLDRSTGTFSYIVPNPSTSILYKYTTLPRNERVSQASVDSIHDESFTSLDLGYSDEEVVFAQRVRPGSRQLGTTQTVWESPDLPISVASGETRTIWASFADPVLSAALVYTATNSPTINFTPFARSAKIEIIGPGSGTTISALSVSGRPAEANADQSAFIDLGFNPPRLGPEIDGEYISSFANAYGLADFITAHSSMYWQNYRGSVRISQRFPFQVQRVLGEAVELVISEAEGGAVDYLLRNIATEVSLGGHAWDTTYGIFPIQFFNDLTPFTLGTSALGGSDVLGY